MKVKPYQKVRLTTESGEEIFHGEVKPWPERNPMTPNRICFIVALVLFILAALGVGLGGLNLIAWGLAALALGLAI